MLAIFIALFLLVCVPAHAAVIDIGQAFGSALQPYIDAVVNGGIAALIGWVLYVVKNRFNIAIEDSHRDALTTFLQRQASSLVAQGAVKLQGVKIEVQNDALAMAANSALSAIPQALTFFGLTTDRVRDMIVDLIPKEPAVAQAQGVALDTANPSTPGKPAA